ncbi:sugar transferase [Paenibacillus xanthanilyticus]|uniref:Sugar transferase n=1 Tax=Paenibacillus xanthanilyticus TaxID=1783531 RepID=A0ABV8K328_9BACL
MYRKFFKRMIDCLAVVLAMPFLLSIILILAILIKIDDGGPVFYRGARLGKHGKVFKMFKLRTMRVNSPDLRNADGSTYNSSHDPRLTKIGGVLRKTSLDELPQLINVLLGDMSLIGPRPDLPEHLNYYEGNEGKKLEVLPGLTGYNQAYFRNGAEWKQRIQNDIYYIENLSLLLDIKITFKTIHSIIKQNGVFTETGNS